MAASVSSARKYNSLTFFFTIVFSINFGSAQQNPAGFAKALLCFNNKFMMIYNGCNEAYRLNQNGNLNVPIAATNEFCQGPCLSETEQLLNCVNNMFSNFVFYNKATVGQVRKVIDQGCSYTRQRGNFNVGDFLQEETSYSSSPVMKPVEIYFVMLVAACSFYALGW